MAKKAASKKKDDDDDFDDFDEYEKDKYELTTMIYVEKLVTHVEWQHCVMWCLLVWVMWRVFVQFCGFCELTDCFVFFFNSFEDEAPEGAGETVPPSPMPPADGDGAPAAEGDGAPAAEGDGAPAAAEEGAANAEEEGAPAAEVEAAEGEAAAESEAAADGEGGA